MLASDLEKQNAPMKYSIGAFAFHTNPVVINLEARAVCSRVAPYLR